MHDATDILNPSVLQQSEYVAEPNPCDVCVSPRPCPFRLQVDEDLHLSVGMVTQFLVSFRDDIDNVRILAQF